MSGKPAQKATAVWEAISGTLQRNPAGSPPNGQASAVRTSADEETLPMHGQNRVSSKLRLVRASIQDARLRWLDPEKSSLPSLGCFARVLFLLDALSLGLYRTVGDHKNWGFRPHA